MDVVVLVVVGEVVVEVFVELVVDVEEVVLLCNSANNSNNCFTVIYYVTEM